MRHGSTILCAITLFTYSSVTVANSTLPTPTDFTSSYGGLLAVFLFICAYSVSITEHKHFLHKCVPVVSAGIIIWCITAWLYQNSNLPNTETYNYILIFDSYILEFLDLFIVILTAMTYVNYLKDRNVFKILRVWIDKQELQPSNLIFITGLITFLLSPLTKSMTTALIMGAVILSIGKDNKDFTSVGLTNVVIASNAGGVLSPFGGFPTLIIWQAGQLDFFAFSGLFLPSLLSWLIPTFFMCLYLRNKTLKYSPEDGKEVHLRRGAILGIFLFITSITLAVIMHQFFHLPSALGMLFGLMLLIFKGNLLTHGTQYWPIWGSLVSPPERNGDTIDVLQVMKNNESNTLWFFCGIILCIGGISALGYFTYLSCVTYELVGTTYTNALAGLTSGLIGNIPVTFAALSMTPQMSSSEWLLLTLTTNIGGSILPLGSVAGIALMDEARGVYTFWSHLKWSLIIIVGCLVSILATMYFQKIEGGYEIIAIITIVVSALTLLQWLIYKLFFRK